MPPNVLISCLPVSGIRKSVLQQRESLECPTPNCLWFTVLFGTCNEPKAHEQVKPKKIVVGEGSSLDCSLNCHCLKQEEQNVTAAMVFPKGERGWE